MMSSVLQWRNHNHYRAFPFMEDAILEDLTEVLTIANDVLLDFYLLVYGDLGTQAQLNRVDVDGGGATVSFRFQYGPAASPLFAEIIVPGSITGPYEAEVRTTGADGETEILIKSTFGAGVADIASNVTFQGNTYFFDTALFEPALVSVNRFDRVTSVNTFKGDVFVEGGFNVSVALLESRNQIRVRAILGAGLGEPCEAQHFVETADCDGPVYYINGQHPDWFGRFTVTGGRGFIVISDEANNKITLKTTVDPNRPKCKDPE